MVLAGLDALHPESVTVNVVHGFPVEELVNVQNRPAWCAARAGSP
jgi:hypothetical protein